MKSIKFLIITCIILGVFLTGVSSLGVAWFYNKREFSNGLVQKARTIHLRLSEVAKFVAGQGGLSRIVDDFTRKYSSPSQMTKDDKIIVLNQVPIYAAMEVGNRSAQQDHYVFRVFSKHPRNKDNMATQEEASVLDQFEKDPNLKEVVAETESEVRVYMPVRISKSHGCLTCHGDPKTSPWGNGQDILGYPMENWVDGRLHAAFLVIQDKKKAHLAQAALGKINSTQIMSFLILMVALISIGIGFVLVNPRIMKLKEVFFRLNEELKSLIASQTKLAHNSSTLSSSATQQAAAAEQVASALEEVRSMVERNNESASSAAESVSGGAEKASEIEDLASSMSQKTEELGNSLIEVLNQLENGTQQMGEIEKMMNHISSQTQIVNDIAFQTKILSFNASVEAARAGDQGKGFAVVAQQVGELATLSSKAASEISDLLASSTKKVTDTKHSWVSQAQEIESSITVRVNEGLEATKHTVEEIQKLSYLVNGINDNVIQISTASKEQSQGVFEINKAISEISSTTQGNATTATEVDKESQVISQCTRNINILGADLSKVIEG